MVADAQDLCLQAAAQAAEPSRDRAPPSRSGRGGGPLLALSLVTGSILVFQPLAGIFLGPSAPAQIKAALKPPAPRKAVLADHPDWTRMIRTARSLYPDAEFRILSLPRNDSGLISLRMRQPDEWIPNGRPHDIVVRGRQRRTGLDPRCP